MRINRRRSSVAARGSMKRHGIKTSTLWRHQQNVTATAIDHSGNQ